MHWVPTRIVLDIFLLAIFLALTACEPADSSETALNKILPLGASRVQGAHPHYESYRYALWQDLIDGEWDFDIVGSVKDDAYYKKYKGLRFDNDHEGRGGWTSTEIRVGLPYWLSLIAPPDIVLFSSPGGNDILQGEEITTIVENVSEIISMLREANPNVTIIIEEMAPGKKQFMIDQGLYDPMVRVRNEIRIIAASRSSLQSKISVVDMHTGFHDSLLADDVHYNTAGAEFIASRYYEVLVNELRR